MVKTRAGQEYSSHPMELKTPPPVPSKSHLAQTPHHQISTKTCFCEETLPEALLIQCKTCTIFYHDECVGLRALRSLMTADEAGVLSLDDWVCPDCLITATLLRPGSPLFEALAAKAAEIFARTVSNTAGEDTLTLKPSASTITPPTPPTANSTIPPATSPKVSDNDVLNTPSSRNENRRLSYAQKAGRTTPQQHRLTIQCCDVKATRALLDKLLDEVPISNVRNLTSSICLRFPNEQSQQLAETKLKASNIFDDPTKVSAEVMSKVTLRFVPVDLLPEESSREVCHNFLLTKLKAKNKLLQDCKMLSIVYFKRTQQDSNFATVALKLPLKLKTQLLAEGRVFFHMSSIKVYHRVHVKRCPHCQGLGHYPDNCPNRGKAPICMFCSENHPTDDCPFKNDATKHQCINCVQSNTYESSHHAGSVVCQSYKAIYDRLSKSEH